MTDIIIQRWLALGIGRRCAGYGLEDSCNLDELLRGWSTKKRHLLLKCMSQQLHSHCYPKMLAKKTFRKSSARNGKTHVRSTSLEEEIARRVTSSTTATTGCRGGLNGGKIETRDEPYQVGYAPHDGTYHPESAWIRFLYLLAGRQRSIVYSCRHVSFLEEW